MRLTQEKFDNIIDLLGNAANAKAVFTALPTGVDRSEAQLACDEAHGQYIQAMTALYHPAESPQILHNICIELESRRCRSEDHSDGSSKSQETMCYSISIKNIRAQLNCDITQEDEYGIETIHSPLSYTGKYQNQVRGDDFSCYPVELNRSTLALLPAFFERCGFNWAAPAQPPLLNASKNR